MASLGLVSDPPDGALAWDAEFELWLGSVISRRLSSEPPPSGSQYAACAQEWAENLSRSGRERQESLGLPRLRPAGGAA